MSGKTTHQAKIEHPAQNYGRPISCATRSCRSRKRKRRSTSGSRDARQLVTASNEGMEGEAIGPDRDENHKLDQVLNAKQKVGARPKPKPAH